MIENIAGHNKSTLMAQVHEAGALVAISLEGRLSRRNVEALTGRLARLFTSGKSAIVIDFSRLKHADYRSLPSFASSLRRLSTCGCQITLCNLSDYVLNIFRVAGCVEGLTICENREEALRVSGFYRAALCASRLSRKKALSLAM